MSYPDIWNEFYRNYFRIIHDEPAGNDALLATLRERVREAQRNLTEALEALQAAEDRHENS